MERVIGKGKNEIESARVMRAVALRFGIIHNLRHWHWSLPWSAYLTADTNCMYCPT